jgi:hypothetical protein
MFTKEESTPPYRKNKMVMRTHYPRHKQPSGSTYCGYYVCEHMRELERYTKDPERVSLLFARIDA